ncbi:MAG: twin transmembrane helix small protein [Proteobacteria bacterium]|nr:twin transmembrane helix small protein [Pseudomonadota bacterium]
MQGILTFLIPLAIGAVTLVLGLGLFNMVRAGSPNRSQTLMRWRVGLQAVAVLLMMLAIFIKTR